MKPKTNILRSQNLELRLATKKGVLFRGDCLDLLASIKPKSVDCVFADPPFNLDKNYGSSRSVDKRPQTEYRHWTNRWLSDCVRILKPGGSLFIYHIPKDLIDIASYLNYFDDMEFRNWIAIKMKNGFPATNLLHAAHYGMLYYVKRGRKPRFHVLRCPSPLCRHCQGLIRDYGGYREKYPTNGDNVPLIRIADFWDDVNPKIHNKNRPKSINELPLIIPERAILMTTNEDDIILDPFAGGGSSLSIAESHNRFWIGTEIGNTVHACNRILKATGAKRQPNIPHRLQRVLV